MKNFRIFLFSVLFLFPLAIFAQQTVKGKVTEATSSDGLPGVDILIKGTTRGASTDFDGNYVLENVKTGDILVVSYLGFKTQEITVNSTTINIMLVEDTESLDEVIVIGYGTTTIKDATGAVSAITEDDFNQGNIVSPASLITGRVAGVNVTTDGTPGGGSAIRIRGGASLGASNDPLIVIDGLPISNSTAGGSRSILASLNPNDIESFSVLKDASSTAIYGSRASNGVIIITTKKGKQSFQAEYNVKVGYQTLANKIDVFSADEFRDIITSRIDGGQTGISVDQLGTANTDWQDEIYQENITIDQNVSVNGMLYNKVPTRLSIGHTKQPGLRKTSKFERVSSSLAMNPKFFDDHLKVNLNANLNFEYNRFADGVEGAALTMDPTQPIYDSSSPFGGFFEYWYTDSAGYAQTMNAPRNPVASLLQRENKSNVKRFYGNVELDYKFHFLPELRAVVNLGYDEIDGGGYNKLDVNSANGQQPEGTDFLGDYSEYTSYKKNSLVDAYLVYNKELENINVEVTGGYSYQKFEAEDYTTNSLIDPDDAEADYTTYADVVLIGFFGRTNLSFFDKYLLTLSYRRDGTSRFSKDNRWGNFPAAAFAWQIGDEDFLKDSETISKLKLRLGWGVTGQQDIDAAYAYLGRYVTGTSVSQYIFGNSTYPIANPQSIFEDIKWEETTTYNVGLDYGLFDNRIYGSLEFYLKESKDLLSEVSVADGSNFSNVGWQNIGNFTSKGIEFAIGSDIIKKEDLNVNVNYNVTFNQTEIDELAAGQDIDTGGIDGGTGSSVQVHREGFAPYSFLVYKQLYTTAGDPIEGAYVDLNQDGVINTDDRYIYKKPTADITMGFQTNVNYKAFDLAFNLRASIGNYMYNNVNSSRAQYNLLQATEALGNMPTSVLESNFNETSEVLLSDYYVENASFLKMDNVTLGYTFKQANEDSAKIRVWTGVQNVFTITNYSGLDPEVFGGIDNTIYPRPRTFLLGANFNF
ncbi:SusC/RagA family TonB-linked outer membrane protein [Lutibacter sp. TH_r2]|uniref:SusC/RagA family TonB-linked outer membrane protein n=1 Tax=Lutibacter sp. TH_r2 TaxID=3082083 RepID=UPI002952DEF7|nr:SusC/RagA family TonB-linked outer membrane protein [Lutibacter sp. TH_r2]MDV7188557.1 SusC/RagA family TonB-linked outer membrane protein [Lutibacter sp. TH_r2]